MSLPKRIILIGNGAIGRPVAGQLSERGISGSELLGIVTTRKPTDPVPGVQYFTDMQAGFDLEPDLVIEAAGGEAFRQYAPACLAQKIDFLAVSVAAMADRLVETSVRNAIKKGGGRLFVASGAIGALEALTAAREAGLSSVSLTQRKPLRAFPGMELARDKESVVSSGTAREAALAFPKNANISAAVALAGIGFDETRVTVVADPMLSSNVAELHAAGEFGEVILSIRNNPSDINPSTARLAGLSVIAALRRLSTPIVIPA